MGSDVERTGMLVVRVWVERDAVMRARITQSLDVEAQEPSISLAAGVDGIRAALSSWLDAFAHGPNGKSPG
jgi:hypothetical protein